MEEKLKILEVVDNWYPIVDGVVQVVNNYAKTLNKIADCTVLCPKYPNTPKIEDYPIRYVPSISGGKYGVRLPLPWLDSTLKKFLDENHFDIIHLHSPVTMAKYILKYAKKHHIPVITTIHTRYHEEINRSVKTPFLQRFALNFLLTSLRKSDYIWTVANGISDLANDFYKIDKPCTVMRNCTDFIPPDEDQFHTLSHSIRTKYGIKDDEIVLLVVGRLVVVKRFDVCIDAIKILKTSGIKVKLLIVGDGDYRQRLEHEAKKMDISDEVVFAGMISDRNTLASYYLASDLLLFPSTFDASSLVPVEAASVGLPSLCVEGSTTAESIIDNHNGYLCDGSKEGFAQKITEILNNKTTYNEVRKNAKTELYRTWESNANDVLEEYKKTIAQYNNICE